MLKVFFTVMHEGTKTFGVQHPPQAPLILTKAVFRFSDVHESSCSPRSLPPHWLPLLSTTANAEALGDGVEPHSRNLVDPERWLRGEHAQTPP